MSVVARLTGVPFASMRGRKGALSLTRKQRSKLGRAGGRASMAKRTPEERLAIGRKAAARTNHVRWGTPLPEWAK